MAKTTKLPVGTKVKILPSVIVERANRSSKSAIGERVFPSPFSGMTGTVVTEIGSKRCFVRFDSPVLFGRTLIHEAMFSFSSIVSI